DSRPVKYSASLRMPADRMNGGFIGRHVTSGVGFGERGFAKHVVGVPEAAGLVPPVVAQRRSDRLAGDKVLAKPAHGERDGRADKRKRAAREKPPRRILFVDVGKNNSREVQAERDGA